MEKKKEKKRLISFSGDCTQRDFISTLQLLSIYNKCLLQMTALRSLVSGGESFFCWFFFVPHDSVPPFKSFWHSHSVRVESRLLHRSRCSPSVYGQPHAIPLSILCKDEATHQSKSSQRLSPISLLAPTASPDCLPKLRLRRPNAHIFPLIKDSETTTAILLS